MKVINNDLLRELRERCRCEICGNEVPTGTDPMHMFARGHGGGCRLDIPENTLAGCRSCHSAQHAGAIKRETLLAIIARREGKSPEEILEIIHRLQLEGLTAADGRDRVMRTPDAPGKR